MSVIFAEHLCPPGWDFTTFFGECWSYTYRNFVARICNFRFDGSLDGYLVKVAETSALDRHRAISRDAAREVTGAGQASEDGDQDVPPDEGLSGISHGSKDLPETWWMKPEWIRSPWSEILTKDRKRIVGLALKYHAFTSEENAECSRVIRWRYKKDWPVSKIAAVIHGEPLTTREKQARERDVYRILDDDYEKLRILFAERFGITSLRDV